MTWGFASTHCVHHVIRAEEIKRKRREARAALKANEKSKGKGKQGKGKPAMTADGIAQTQAQLQAQLEENTYGLAGADDPGNCFGFCNCCC